MENNYKLKELKIIIRPGVELTAIVDSISDVTKLLEDLKKENFESVTIKPPELGAPPLPPNLNLNNFDDPHSKIELQASLQSNSLIEKKVLAFKDNIPQLLRPNIFGNTTEALLVLLYAIEVGLNKKSIEYDAFKSLYDGQNIKSGSSLSMLLNNLKNSQYIDKNTYDKDRTIILTAKGAQKGVEILNIIIKK